jgi:hypothetical protein
MIKNWQDFEEWVKNLLKFDNAKLTPGSGSSKKEEDVVGESLLAQCKFTDSENISILRKDIERLNISSQTIDKFPLFLNHSSGINTITLQINDDTEKVIYKILQVIKSYIITENLYFDITDCKDIKLLEVYDEKLKNINKTIESICVYLKSRTSTIEKESTKKWRNLSNYNLFDS